MRKRRLYVAPLNDLAQKLRTELEANGYVVEAFIDNFKQQNNVVSSNDVKANSIVFITSPNYEKQIADNLSSHSCFFVKELNGEYHFIGAQSALNHAAYHINKLSVRTSNLGLSISKCLYEKAHVSLFNQRKMHRIQDSQKRKKGFVICNGPSLRTEDLDKIKGHVSIGCNKIYLSYKQTTWRPTYYVIQDKLVYKNLRDQLCNVRSSTLLLPYYMLGDFRHIKDAIYFKTRTFKTELASGSTQFISSDPMRSGFITGNSTIFLMIQMLIFAGCKEICIMGADFNYDIPENKRGKQYLTTENQNHFDKDYRPSNEVWTAPRIEDMFTEIDYMARDARQKGIKIYNLSPESKIDSFEKVTLSDILKVG